MKKITVCLALLTIFISAFAQNDLKKENVHPFYIGLDAGVIRNTYYGTGFYEELEDLQNEKFFMNASAKLTFGYNISECISLETGLGVQNYTEWYYEKNDYSYGITGFKGPSNHLSIPIQAIYRFKLLNDKLEINPYAGISIFMLTKKPGGYNRGTAISFSKEYDENLNLISTDTLTIITTTTYYDNKISLVGNAGLRLEYNISPRISIMANACLSLGFTDINRLAVVIEKQESTNQGFINSKGTGYSLNAGLKFKFGKIK